VSRPCGQSTSHSHSPSWAPAAAPLARAEGDLPFLQSCWESCSATGSAHSSGPWSRPHPPWSPATPSGTVVEQEKRMFLCLFPHSQLTAAFWGEMPGRTVPLPAPPSIPSIKVTCHSSPKTPMSLGQRGRGSATKACGHSAAAFERLFLSRSGLYGSGAP